MNHSKLDDALERRRTDYIVGISVYLALSVRVSKLIYCISFE